MPNPVRITLNHIRKHKPYAQGWKNVLEANGGTKADLSKLFPLRSILDANVNGEGLEDTIWCFRCLPAHNERFLKFVTFCRKTVCDLLEKEEAQDCVKEVGRFLKGNLTLEELRDAYGKATEAMDEATNAVAGIVYAATEVHSVSTSAQDVASVTAYHAARTYRGLYSVASTVADEAEKAERQKQIDYLRKLLDGEV